MMVLTTTAIAFILLSVGLAFCGWRFLRAFLKSSDSKLTSKTGLLLSVFLFTSSLQNGTLGMGALLFAKNPLGLYAVVLLSHLFLVAMSFISIYLLFYVLFPKKVPIIAFLLLSVLSISFISLTIFYHPQPFLTQESGIDWGVGFPLSTLMFSLFVISLIPPTHLFLKIFSMATSRELKLVSFAVAMLCLAGIINVFARLVLFQGGPPTLRTQLLDMGVAIIGMGFTLVFVIIPLVKSFFETHRKTQLLR